MHNVHLTASFKAGETMYAGPRLRGGESLDDRRSMWRTGVRLDRGMYPIFSKFHSFEHTYVLSQPDIPFTG